MYNPGNRKAQAARALLAGLLRWGIAPPSLPRVAPAEGSGMTELLDHLGELLGSADTRFAVSLGTPGPNRKPVIQGLDPDGRVLGFVKLGWDAETESLLRNEARALESLTARPPRSYRCPELLDTGRWGKLFLLVQSAAPSGARSAPGSLSPPVMESLREMGALASGTRELEGSAFWKRLEKKAGGAASPLYRGTLERGLRCLAERLRGRPLPFHLSHGDFTPWNMLVVDGRIYLFDWECSDAEAPAGYDLFHFLVQTGLLLARQAPDAVYESLLGEAAGGNGNRAALESLLGGMELAGPLLLLYLMERIAHYAGRPHPHFRTLSRLSALASLCLAKEERLP
jgi:hypothetical protein